jgi:hypothetical protein
MCNSSVCLETDFLGHIYDCLQSEFHTSQPLSLGEYIIKAVIVWCNLQKHGELKAACS